MQSLLNNKQAQVLINEINRLSRLRTPPIVAMIRKFAFNISGSWPGKNWANRWIYSHQDDIYSIYLKGFDISRKKADSWKKLKKYFNLIISLFSLIIAI